MSSQNRIVVLASGNGTTFQAIVDAIGRGELDAEVALLVTDRPGIPVLRRADAAGIPATVVDRGTVGLALSDRIVDLLPVDTDLIVLAGFLSILRGRILERFKNRIINVHPSLLPKFGGAGMYGIHVHRAVIASGETESGCTVHYVDEGTDTGPTILQRALPVYPDDTAESLAERIGELERPTLIEAITLALRPEAR